MGLFNPGWITFDGTPVAGMVPTRLRVHSSPPGAALSGPQVGFVKQAYGVFCNTIRVSPHPNGLHSQHRTAPDGMQIRMSSIQGVHQVDVFPPPIREGITKERYIIELWEESEDFQSFRVILVSVDEDLTDAKIELPWTTFTYGDEGTLTIEDSPYKFGKFIYGTYVDANASESLTVTMTDIIDTPVTRPLSYTPSSVYNARHVRWPSGKPFSSEAAQVVLNIASSGTTTAPRNLSLEERAAVYADYLAAPLLGKASIADIVVTTRTLWPSYIWPFSGSKITSAGGRSRKYTPEFTYHKRVAHRIFDPLDETRSYGYTYYDSHLHDGKFFGGYVPPPAWTNHYYDAKGGSVVYGELPALPDVDLSSFNYNDSNLAVWWRSGVAVSLSSFIPLNNFGLTRISSSEGGQLWGEFISYGPPEDINAGVHKQLYFPEGVKLPMGVTEGVAAIECPGPKRTLFTWGSNPESTPSNPYSPYPTLYRSFSTQPDIWLVMVEHGSSKERATLSIKALWERLKMDPAELGPRVLVNQVYPDLVTIEPYKPYPRT